MRNSPKRDHRHDAGLLQQAAAKMEQMQLGGASPFWRFVARPQLEEGLKCADKKMIRRLRKLDSRETTAETLVRKLRRLAAERSEMAG